MMASLLFNASLIQPGDSLECFPNGLPTVAWAKGIEEEESEAINLETAWFFSLA